MSMRSIFTKIKINKIAKRVKSKGTFIGSNHRFTAFSNIVLRDGAKKENIIVESGVWFEGMVRVDNNGKVIIHENAKIAASTNIFCVNYVEIGAYTAIAEHTTICDNNNHPISPSYRKIMRMTPANDPMRYWRYSDHAPIKIGENCWIGSDVRICKGVSIGDNSIIAACSVVTKDVPANCIVAGNPAKIVKTDIDKLPEPEYP